jgi:hypothetical protein
MNTGSSKNQGCLEYDVKFDEFWTVIVKKLSIPTKLFTLKQGKEFSARYVGGFVEISPKNKQQRSIHKNEFLKVWMKAKNTLDPFVPSNYTNITFHSSYVVAIMKHFLIGKKIE